MPKHPYNRGVLTLNYEDIARLLGLQAGYEVTHALPVNPKQGQEIKIIINGPGMPHVPGGQVIPEVGITRSPFGPVFYQKQKKVLHQPN